jgi:hypothetical protein
MTVAAPTLTDVQALVGSWWFDYDQGDRAAWPRYFTPDARFTCRSDSGQTDFEDFIRADLTGRDEVLAWNTEHRNASPYPLRHFVTNLHLVATENPHPDETAFRSYLFCTHIVGTAVANLASGRVLGTARTDPADSTARLADLRVTLDFTDSVPFTEATRHEPA